MTKESLILIGAGGHARSCIDVIEQQGQYEISGLIGTSSEMHTQQLGYSVIGTDSSLSELINLNPYALITVGQILKADQRINLYELAIQIGFQLPFIISPKAHFSRNAKIGEGSIIMHGAIVNVGASVGKNCIINSRALIEHDTKVEDHCHISTGAILNGGVTVGSGSFVGSNSVIKQGVKIGESCLVGMGLTVQNNLSDNTYFNDNKI